MGGVVTRIVGWITWHLEDPTDRAIRTAQEARDAERTRLRSEGEALRQNVGRRRSERLRRDARRVVESR